MILKASRERKEGKAQGGPECRARLRATMGRVSGIWLSIPLFTTCAPSSAAVFLTYLAFPNSANCPALPSTPTGVSKEQQQSRQTDLLTVAFPTLQGSLWSCRLTLRDSFSTKLLPTTHNQTTRKPSRLQGTAHPGSLSTSPASDPV